MPREYATITIERYRTPDGKPTCCWSMLDSKCRFLSARRNFEIPVCLFEGADLDFYENGIVTKPFKSCPVWHGEPRDA